MNSELITNIISTTNNNVKYLKNNSEIVNNFYQLTNRNDLIINMGAGDCHNFWSSLDKKYIKKL